MELPTQWYTNATATVNAAQSCGELQKITNELFATLTPLQSQLTSQLALLNTLTVSPTNLAGCINWIQSYIAVVTGPIAKVTTQIAELTSAIASLTSAITNKASQLNCSGITIP